MKILYITLAILFFFVLPVYANDSYEISLRQTYLEYCSIVVPDTPTYDPYEKGVRAVDYAVEILKSPASLEAYYTIFLLAETTKDEKIREKFVALKNKHMPFINDTEYEPAEKLVFILLLMSLNTSESREEIFSNQQVAYDALNNMISNCKNRDYIALAMMESF